MFEIGVKLETISDRLSKRQIVKDARGTEIGQVRRKRTPNVHNTTYLGTKNNEKKCSIKSKGTTNATRTMGITEFSANICLSDKVIGQVGGDWTTKSVHIVLFENSVARISKEKAGMALRQDSYCVEIRPFVDSAFITMIIIALGEIYPEDN